MASIEKARSRGYVVRYRDPSGRQRSKTVRTKADAERLARTIEVDKDRREYLDPDAGRVLLRDHAQRWRASVVNLKPASLARDDDTLRNHVLPCFGDRPLADIDHMAVQAWVAELTASGLAPATVHKCYQVLAKIMRSAVSARLLRASPCVDVSLPRIERREMKFCTPEQAAELAAAIDPAYSAFVYLGAYAGLRRGEMFALRRRRLDLMHGRVEVAESVIEVRGQQVWGSPKSRTSHRTVPLPRFLVDVLTLHCAGLDPDALVFTSPGGLALRGGLFRSRVWLPATARAGLDGLRLHDLRHTAVAFWIAAGASPKEIAMRAGHSSVSVVLDRYGHLLPGHEVAVNDKLDVFAAQASAAVRQMCDEAVPARFADRARSA